MPPTDFFEDPFMKNDVVVASCGLVLSLHDSAQLVHLVLQPFYVASELSDYFVNLAEIAKPLVAMLLSVVLLVLLVPSLTIQVTLHLLSPFP